MLDINLIREDPGRVAAALAKRGFVADFAELLAWDKERREAIASVERMKADRNKASAEVPRLMKEGADVSALTSGMKELSEKIRARDAAVGAVGAKIEAFLASIPNTPDDDVPAGDKDQNVVERVWGEKPPLGPGAKNHVDLVTELRLVDYERGVKLGGSGFWLYAGDGALMEWALLNYFVEEHLKDGYVFLLPPHILNYACGYTAGQFPKFEGDVFALDRDDGADLSFMLPTAETALVNVHRGEVLDEADLPKKYFAYTPCYRKEAGSARTEERGMIRGHQFNKVELVQYTAPERSDDALEELAAKAERLVRGLGLHYRVSKLAAGDVSAAMAKTYDIEVWLPSMGIYKEVSSASNSRDYQARRGDIRFRRKGARRNEFVHTLNASGLATSRIMPAIVEQLQRPDGSVTVPEPLRKWVGKEVLEPKQRWA